VANPTKTKTSEDASYAERVGAVIRAKWTLTGLLGVGGMAAVYAASHRNGQVAALKILHLGFAKDRNVCERFLREAYVSNKVGHPATVSVLDDDMTEEGEPFLVMELLLGLTVRDVWRKAGRTLSIPHALQICERVVDCLAACHELGIIHRDLKPANVFITNKGDVRVLDFGVAQMRSAATERTAAGTALGTPSYMSPEQARGRVDDLDGRADLFSVGAMLHALITGHRINAGKTESEALAMAAMKPVSSVARIAPNLPVQIVQIIDQALQFDRRNRFADAREMQSALISALTQCGHLPLAGLRGERLVSASPDPSPAHEHRVPASAQGPSSNRPPSLQADGGEGGEHGQQERADLPPAAPIVRPHSPHSPVEMRAPTQVVATSAKARLGPGVRDATPRSLGQSHSLQGPIEPRTEPSAPALAGRAEPPYPSIKHDPTSPSDRREGTQAIATDRLSMTDVSPPAVEVAGAHYSVSQAVSQGVGHVRKAVDGAPKRQEDPRLADLRDLVKHLDRLLPSVRQFGWSHPATERTMRTLFQVYSEALRRDPTVFQFSLRPYSLMAFEGTAWEPTAPFDAIPYNLFACGMRELRIEAGVTYEELRDLIAIILKDPATDLPPEDDLVTALWDRDLRFVRYECCDAFVEGEASEREAFLTEADVLEGAAGKAAFERASRLEARAMAIATDARARSNLSRAESPLAVDDVVRNVLCAELDLDSGKWTERFVDALVEGYVNAAICHDAPLVLSALRKSSADLIVAERVSIVADLRDALAEQIGRRISTPDDARKLVTALTHAMFGGDVFQLLIRLLAQKPLLVAPVLSAFALLSQKELRPALTALREPLPQELRDALLHYVERVLPGYEHEVAKVLVDIGADESYALLSVLARVATPEAVRVLTELQGSDNVDLRISARMLLAVSPETAELEVAQLIEHAQALTRLSALRMVVRYRMRGAWPTLVRVVSAMPQGLGSDEKLALIRALICVDPGRGEPLVVEIAKKGNLVPSEERDGFRIASCQALGELSSSRATLMSMNEVSQTRWGTALEVRDAAAAAVRMMTERLQTVAAL
jgi:serine/threonine protein kinase